MEQRVKAGSLPVGGHFYCGTKKYMVTSSGPKAVVAVIKGTRKSYEFPPNSMVYLSL